MPNLEELIEMRKSSIEKALKYYDTIEEKLKENAKYFYNNHINPELERQAKTNVNSAGIIYLINDEYVLSAPIVDRNSPIEKWLSSIMNGDDNILLIAICKLLNIKEDPIIAIDISEKPEDDRNYLCFKVSKSKNSSISLPLIVIFPVPSTNLTLAIELFLLPVPLYTILFDLAIIIVPP